MAWPILFYTLWQPKGKRKRGCPREREENSILGKKNAGISNMGNGRAKSDRQSNLEKDNL